MSKPPSSGAAPEPLHVLVVDDSAVVRQVTAKLLAAEPGVSVSVASDPLIAMDQMRRRRPDVILLDLELPKMDGLSFLRKIMAEDPIPVVVCAGLAGARAERGLRALEEGALEIVAKPSLGVGDFLRASSAQLVESLRAAAQARLTRRVTTDRPDTGVASARARSRAVHDGGDFPRRIVAVGASTGGTEAIRCLLAALPRESPGLLIVQHMPEPYTRAFAGHLDAISALEVRQAEGGDVVRSGLALIAPGGRHLRLTSGADAFSVSLDDGPLVSRHRPSVDVLFRSVAKAAGAGAVGVLLTGMGSDGAAGLLEMRRRGAATIAQDEATSVVFGMPRVAIERGAAERVIPLDAIPDAILECAASRPRS